MKAHTSTEQAGEFAGHTNAPWHVAVNTNTGRNEIEVRGRNGFCCVASGLGDGPEAEANARLIAAAPTLLAERDALRESLQAYREANREARAKLAATQEELNCAYDSLRLAREQLRAAIADGGYKLRAQLDAAINAHNGLLSERNQLVETCKAIDKLTCNCPCMSLQAEHEFGRSPDADAYRTSLAAIVLEIRKLARDAAVLAAGGGK